MSRASRAVLEELELELVRHECARSTTASRRRRVEDRRHRRTARRVRAGIIVVAATPFVYSVIQTASSA